MKPVIVVVAYRRLHTLKRLLKSISEGIFHEKQITLIISIDYHPNNSDVISCAKEFVWAYGKKIVCTHERNLGLQKHIIECGNYAIEYDCVILLEDDEMVSPMFYEYTRSAQEYYAEEDRVAGISLYGREWNDYECNRFQSLDTGGDVYFGQFSCTRGQSWTAKQWANFICWYEQHETIEKDEKLPPPIYQWRKSWGKYFVRYLVEEEKYYVIPRKAVCTVYGEKGTHSETMELHVQNAMYYGNEKFTYISFDKGQKYDIFFENVNLKGVISERYSIPKDEIAIDIYGLMNRVFRQRYILTTKNMKYISIADFDLNLRPHELNVFLETDGNCIHLYDTNLPDKKKKKNKWDRIDYDFAGARGFEAIQYGIHHLLISLQGVIRRRMRIR